MFLLPQGPPPNAQRWALYAHHLGAYMRRWILRTPWGTLRLHRILRSDDDRHLHDHPFDFTSFLLTGGYIEETLGEEPGEVHLSNFSEPLRDEIAAERLKRRRTLKAWPMFSIVRKRAEDSHRLILERPIWTFVISGPKRRSWGFITEKGWIHHGEYGHVFPEVVDRRLL